MEVVKKSEIFDMDMVEALVNNLVGKRKRFLFVNGGWQRKCIVLKEDPHHRCRVENQCQLIRVVLR